MPLLKKLLYYYQAFRCVLDNGNLLNLLRLMQLRVFYRSSLNNKEIAQQPLPIFLQNQKI